MFHLAAYFTSNLGAVSTFTPLGLVADGYLPTTTTGFLMPSDMSLVAAYAAQTNLAMARVNAPSLLRTAYPYIRPINSFVVIGSGTDPNVQRLVSQPPQLRATESVSVEVQTNAGVAANAYALLWLCQQLERVPAGEKFTVRFKSTTNTSPNVWSNIGTVTFDQSLPPAQYAVVGLEHWCTNGVAARLLFPGRMAMRPGTLSTNVVGARTNDIFYEGGLGVYGTFNSYAPPQVEVLTDQANNSHEVYLTLIRIGDVTHAATCPPTGSP